MAVRVAAVMTKVIGGIHSLENMGDVLYPCRKQLGYIWFQLFCQLKSDVSQLKTYGAQLILTGADIFQTQISLLSRALQIYKNAGFSEISLSAKNYYSHKLLLNILASMDKSVKIGHLRLTPPVVFCCSTPCLC